MATERDGGALRYIRAVFRGGIVAEQADSQLLGMTRSSLIASSRAAEGLLPIGGSAASLASGGAHRIHFMRSK